MCLQPALLHILRPVAIVRLKAQLGLVQRSRLCLLYSKARPVCCCFYAMPAYGFMLKVLPDETD
eukprot:1138272-Pelagomonas_calceolata.AAC.2